MEKKWDTVIPEDLKRPFVSGTYMYPLVTKGLSRDGIFSDVGRPNEERRTKNDILWDKSEWID